MACGAPHTVHTAFHAEAFVPSVILIGRLMVDVHVPQRRGDGVDRIDRGHRPVHLRPRLHGRRNLGHASCAAD